MNELYPGSNGVFFFFFKVLTFNQPSGQLYFVTFVFTTLTCLCRHLECMNIFSQYYLFSLLLYEVCVCVCVFPPHDASFICLTFEAF